MNGLKPSPLNLRGLLHTQHVVGEPVPDDKLDRLCPTMVVMYRCSYCDELHDDEDDAADCCRPPSPQPRNADVCPVCNQVALNVRDAADCCLWKDLDAATRERIALDLEVGATWLEAIERHAA